MTSDLNDFITNSDRNLILGILQPGALHCLDEERILLNIKSKTCMRIVRFIIDNNNTGHMNSKDDFLLEDLRSLAGI